MGRSNEAGIWSIFSAGGVIAAVLLPAAIVITGIAIPAGWVTADGLLRLISHPLTRIYLFVIISLPLFHAAHRLRMVLVDTGLRSVAGLVATVCYGIAVIGTALALLFLVQIQT